MWKEGPVLFSLAVVVCAGCKTATESGERRPLVSIETKAAQLSDRMSFCRPALGESGMVSTSDQKGGNADWWRIPAPCDGKELYEAARLKGPGCVTRIWQTNVPATEWLFYFDGEAEPRLRLKPDELFSNDARLGPLRGDVSGGAYSYVPLPYQKSLRIVLRIPERRKDARPYFQINYEDYPSGTRVASWPRGYDATVSSALMRCNGVWRQTHATMKQAAEGGTWDKRVLAPKQNSVIFTAEGEGTITALRIRLDLKQADALARSLVLHTLVLEAYWDGAKQASVQVPLGDFFCNGLHPREFASLTLANVDGVYVCRLPMPFRKGALLSIRNDGPLAVACETSVDLTPGAVSDALYFHAAFHSSHKSPTARGKPFQIVKATGQGKYVGCYLIALGTDGSWNMLEGDEAFYRDGRRAPCGCGTGLEDYFNGGWYYYGLFERPLHGLLEKAAMRTAQYRFHLSDPVTFNRSLRMDFEFGDGNEAGGYMFAVAYWYQSAPASAESEIPTLAERFPSTAELGTDTIMDELFELERMGLIADAQERCEFYAAAFGSRPERFVFLLRAAAYLEMREGYAAARDTYRSLATSDDAPPEVAAQAKLLLWRGERPGRAIVGVHGSGDYRVAVDGTLIVAGNQPQIWRAFPVELTPGEHVLEGEIIPQTAQSFISIGFSSFFTNVVSDASWDYRVPSADASDPRSRWRPYETVPGFFPTMAFWRFMPNGVPCVQSGQQEGGPFPGWADQAGRSVRIRRKIVVPDAAGDRPPMPPRVYQMPGAAVRPADDTSNRTGQGL